MKNAKRSMSNVQIKSTTIEETGSKSLDISSLGRQGSFLDQFSEHFNFTVSLTTLSNVGAFDGVKNKFTTEEFTEFELKNNIRKLDKLCLKPEKDRHQLHVNRKRALLVIKAILKRGNPDDLTEENVVHLLWAMFLCIHHFQIRLKTSNGIIACYRKKIFHNTLKMYEKLLYFIPENYNEAIIYSTLVFCREGRLWRLEYLCREIIVPLIIKTSEFEKIISYILTACELLSIENIYEAHYCLQVINYVIDRLELEDISSFIITKLLNMFRSSIEPLPSDYYNYFPLKNGIFQCLNQLAPYMSHEARLNLIETIYGMLEENESDKVIREMAELIVKSEIFNSSLGLLELDQKVHTVAFKHWTDTNINTIIFLSKVCITAADTAGNKINFETPILFLQNGNYNLRIKKYFKESQKRYSGFLYNMRVSFLTCLKNFKDSREVLEHIYCILCIFTCQLPSGITAASICCLALGIQSFALAEKSTMSFEHASHLHAMVISLLTLVCYINKAEEFYSYLNRIIHNRAKYANHLLPPLKVRNDYPRHLVLWNPPAFTLDKWEIRYGLWKCLRIKGKRYRNEYNTFT